MTGVRHIPQAGPRLPRRPAGLVPRAGQAEEAHRARCQTARRPEDHGGSAANRRRVRSQLQARHLRAPRARKGGHPGYLGEDRIRGAIGSWPRRTEGQRRRLRRCHAGRVGPHGGDRSPGPSPGQSRLCGCRRPLGGQPHTRYERSPPSARHDGDRPAVETSLYEVAASMGVILAERYLATGRSVKTATQWSVRVSPFLRAQAICPAGESSDG